jgi:hypothetical protein
MVFVTLGTPNSAKARSPAFLLGPRSSISRISYAKETRPSQLAKVEIDFETLVAGDIAAAIIR